VETFENKRVESLWNAKDRKRVRMNVKTNRIVGSEWGVERSEAQKTSEKMSAEVGIVLS
jgi:hypothetical protein